MHAHGRAARVWLLSHKHQACRKAGRKNDCKNVTARQRKHKNHKNKKTAEIGGLF
jgi:hypothetical protein